MTRARPPDPYAKAPIDELHEPVLPRWFVLLALGLIPLAFGVAAYALLGSSPEQVPVAERRPPPDGELTHAVGAWRAGSLEPVPYDAACPELEGVRSAGTEADRRLLRSALAGLCNVELEAPVAAALRSFAEAGGVVRFAVFEATGVDSAATRAGDPPAIYVNAKFVQLGRARWIAPAIAHDAVMLAGDPETAATALAARQAEDAVCRRLLGGERPSRGCEDAAALLALPDPLAALRAAGYR